MKSIYISILFSVTLLFGCSEDFLERAPLHAPSETTFWRTEYDAEIALNELYNYLPNARRWWTECYSDNAIMTNAWGEAGLGQIKQGNLSPTTGHIQADYFWSEWKYQDIRRILNYLQNLETIEFENQDNARKFEGQARFILAMKYFRMSRYWGDLPLVKSPITLEESRTLERSSQKEVFEYILENINIAVNFLPDADDKTGRITQDAALMLKAEILMWMASMDQFHSRSISDESADQLWRKAANTLGALIQKNRYQLSDDLTNLFLSKTNNARSEVILARQYVEEEITNFIDILGLPGGVGLRGGGWASFSAPRNLIDTYETTNGMSIQEDPAYDVTDPWANRDKRLLEWFLLPGKDVLRVTPAGQEFIYTPFESHPEIGNPEAIGGEGGGGRSGYWCIKHVDLEATHVWGWTNWIIYRYADALLLYAEALNETAPANDSISWAMDQVRTRAGLPSVDALQGNQVDMRAKIWHERRVEMVSEEKRYFDLLRWKEAENAMNPPGGVLYGINESLDDYQNRPGDWTAPKVVAEPISFDATKGYLWPVPQSVRDKNPNISQNPNW